MATTASGTAITFSDSTTATTGKQFAALWVTFNSAGTVLRQYNVSSVTKIGTGDYRVNYAITLSTTNYAFTVAGSAVYGYLFGASPNTTTTLRIQYSYYNVGNFDQNPGSVIVFV